jgi:histidine ammonia-lyase
MTALHLSPGRLTLDQLRSVWTNPVAVTLDRDARARIDAAADTVAGVIAEGRIVYGVNTGFGLLARTHIDATRLAELQRALVLSHSAGTGPPLDDAVVRLTLLLKIASLARGYSGVRYEVVDALLKLLNSGVVPVVPSQGSVGASGDLAPLAHLAGVLIGEGEARIDGRTMPAKEALTRAGMAPLRLAAKEGLALLNGTQVDRARLPVVRRRRVLPPRWSRARSRWTPHWRRQPFDERIQASRTSRRRMRRLARPSRQRDSRLAPRLSARSDPRPAPPAAGHGCLPRPDAPRRGGFSPGAMPYRTILSYFRKRAKCSLARPTASRSRSRRMA